MIAMRSTRSMTNAPTQSVAQALASAVDGKRDGGCDLGDEPNSQYGESFQDSSVRGEPDCQRAGAGGG